MTIVLALAQGERHDGAIEQADDAAQRADPGKLLPAPSASTSARGSGAAVAGPRSAIRLPPGSRPTSCRGPNNHRPAEPARGLRHACAGSRPVPVPARWHAVRVPLVLLGATRGAISADSAMRRGPYQVRDLLRPQWGQRIAAQPGQSSAARACMRAGISSLNSSRNISGMLSPSAPVRYRSARNLALEQQRFALGFRHAIRRCSRRNSVARDDVLGHNAPRLTRSSHARV